MTLAAAATGSGKTVTMALMALAAIRRGFGVVVVDLKPDDFLLRLLQDAADRAGRRLTAWRTTVLTKRDQEIVKWVGRHGAVQAQHVMTRFSIGQTVAYRRMHELVKYGLTRRHRLLYNDAGLLTATPDGLRWADLERLTPARISLVLLPQTIALAALAALLESDLTNEMLLSDREHRAAERAAAQPLRRRSWVRIAAIEGLCTARISSSSVPAGSR
jgi:hypothetical protein